MYILRIDDINLLNLSMTNQDNAHPIQNVLSEYTPIFCRHCKNDLPELKKQIKPLYEKQIEQEK